MHTALQQRRAEQLDILIETERRVRMSRWGYFRRMLVLVFVESDTTTIRALMALASIGFAVCCIPDAIWPDPVHLLSVPVVHWHGWRLFGWEIHSPGPLSVFDRPLYTGLKAVMPDWAWGSLFGAHAIGVIWRFLDLRVRIYWALAVNALGVGLWFLSTLLMTWQVGELVPSMALEWVMVGALFVSLCRTGLNEEKTSP